MLIGPVKDAPALFTRRCDRSPQRRHGGRQRHAAASANAADYLGDGRPLGGGLLSLVKG